MNPDVLNKPESDAISLKIIADLVHRYAVYIRRGEGGACADLFVQDAIYSILEVDAAEPGNSPKLRRDLVGREAIREFLISTGTHGIRLCPLIHNLIVTLGDDEASGECVMESRTWPPGHETIGEYRDTFRNVDGFWLFQSRRFVIFTSAGGA
jgi:hypothetical protein